MLFLLLYSWCSSSSYYTFFRQHVFFWLPPVRKKIPSNHIFSKNAHTYKHFFFLALPCFVIWSTWNSYWATESYFSHFCSFIDAPTLKTFKARMDGALSTLLKEYVFLFIAMKLDWVAFQLKLFCNSMILRLFFTVPLQCCYRCDIKQILWQAQMLIRLRTVKLLVRSNIFPLFSAVKSNKTPEFFISYIWTTEWNKAKTASSPVTKHIWILFPLQNQSNCD